MDRLADDEVGHVDFDVIRNFGREHLERDAMQVMIEHAALVAYAFGGADDVHRDLDFDRFVFHDGVEIEVDHVGTANGIALDFTHQRRDRRFVVDRDVEQCGLAADRLEELAEGAMLDGERARSEGVTVDDRGHLAGAAQ